MHNVSLNFMTGVVSIDSSPVVVDASGMLARSIAMLCSRPVYDDDGHTRYDVSGKCSVCGKAANCLILINNGNVSSVTFLFDEIKFLKSSILESRTLKSCERSQQRKFKSDHPSTAYLDPCEWGSATFYYDPKQGDLSLDIEFKHTAPKTDH